MPQLTQITDTACPFVTLRNPPRNTLIPATIISDFGHTSLRNLPQFTQIIATIPTKNHVFMRHSTVPIKEKKEIVFVL